MNLELLSQVFGLDAFRGPSRRLAVEPVPGPRSSAILYLCARRCAQGTKTQCGDGFSCRKVMGMSVDVGVLSPLSALKGDRGQTTEMTRVACVSPVERLGPGSGLACSPLPGASLLLAEPGPALPGFRGDPLKPPKWRASPPPGCPTYLVFCQRTSEQPQSCLEMSFKGLLKLRR